MPANSRRVALAGKARFRRRDYRHHDKLKLMTLAAEEFIRRFLLQTLPDGFHRIRFGEVYTIIYQCINA